MPTDTLIWASKVSFKSLINCWSCSSNSHGSCSSEYLGIMSIYSHFSAFIVPRIILAIVLSVLSSVLHRFTVSSNSSNIIICSAYVQMLYLSAFLFYMFYLFLYACHYYAWFDHLCVLLRFDLHTCILYASVVYIVKKFLFVVCNEY